MYSESIDFESDAINVYASEEGITHISFADDKVPFVPNRHTQRAVEQLQEYIQNERTEFDLTLAPKGTDFQKKVWNALCEIDFGDTCSYQTIAERIGQPTASRAVGAANSKNPIAIVVPCHRVIGADGSLTGYAGGLERKRWLLELEGFRFASDQVVQQSFNLE